MRYVLIGVTTVVIGSLIVAGVLYLADVGIGRPLRHELPAGYRGWALVEYQRPHCPELSVQGIRLIVSYDATGRACTSSPRPLGWRYRTFVYVEPGGARHATPEEMLHSYSHSIGDNTDTFFVGTSAEFAADRTPLHKRYRKE